MISQHHINLVEFFISQNQNYVKANRTLSWTVELISKLTKNHFIGINAKRHFYTEFKKQYIKMRMTQDILIDKIEDEGEYIQQCEELDILFKKRFNIVENFFHDWLLGFFIFIDHYQYRPDAFYIKISNQQIQGIEFLEAENSAPITDYQKGYLGYIAFIIDYYDLGNVILHRIDRDYCIKTIDAIEFYYKYTIQSDIGWETMMSERYMHSINTDNKDNKDNKDKTTTKQPNKKTHPFENILIEFINYKTKHNIKNQDIAKLFSYSIYEFEHLLKNNNFVHSQKFMNKIKMFISQNKTTECSSEEERPAWDREDGDGRIPHSD